MDTSVQVHARLRRVEGQVQGVQRMLHEGRRCEDVLTQLLAIRAAVEQAFFVMTEQHIRDCILGDELERDDPRVQQIVDALKLLARSGA